MIKCDALGSPQLVALSVYGTGPPLLTVTERTQHTAYSAFEILVRQANSAQRKYQHKADECGVQDTMMMPPHCNTAPYTIQ